MHYPSSLTQKRGVAEGKCLLRYCSGWGSLLPHSWTSAGALLPHPFPGVTWPGKPAAPHPSRRLRRTARETAPPVGGGPRSPRTPPLSNGFPRSSGGRAFPQKEVSSVAGKVLELQESPAAWACPRVPPPPPPPALPPQPPPLELPRGGARLPRKDLTGHFLQLCLWTESSGVQRSQSPPGARVSHVPAPVRRPRPSLRSPPGSQQLGRACVVTGATGPAGVRSYRGTGGGGGGGGGLGAELALAENPIGCASSGGPGARNLEGSHRTRRGGGTALAPSSPRTAAALNTARPPARPPGPAGRGLREEALGARRRGLSAPDGWH
ncbi:WAS/WASL-interacting protein family member 3-like [Herpailurus yagouaroundi]|uniref:WAS/WASL-interacting protein family member 3-like n=1 Tax=Herpailurus yagouaroundi TaxID=1608482 RepID=UPI001AD759C4|nr:WAS/WASL-interacting protein family member 3-like [Puma yagouaroundi]